MDFIQGAAGRRLGARTTYCSEPPGLHSRWLRKQVGLYASTRRTHHSMARLCDAVLAATPFRPLLPGCQLLSSRLPALAPANDGRRTLPLIGVPDGDRLVLVASNYGRRRNPAWYYNLKANPQCSATYRGQHHEMEAYEAEGDERQRLWELDVSVYPPRNHYARRAEIRRIPVMVLQLAPTATAKRRPPDRPLTSTDRRQLWAASRFCPLAAKKGRPLAANLPLRRSAPEARATPVSATAAGDGESGLESALLAGRLIPTLPAAARINPRVGNV
jgi:deazaflavin-dependent oxidoreductase (nitroreductase family)